jgi:hypothetical protein
MVVSQENIVDLIIPGLSEYNVEHNISPLNNAIEGGTVTFKDKAGNETTVNVEMTSLQLEYIRSSGEYSRGFNSITISSAYVQAQQMENRVKLVNKEVRSYYGVKSSEVDMFMSRGRDLGAVSYLACAKGIKNISKNTNGTSVGSDYKTNTSQSTTGNIYGIYDMNGGTQEFVAMYVDAGQENLAEYGQSLINADNKYKDVIKVTGGISISDKLRLYKGIAMSETSNFNGVNATAPTNNNPYIVRTGLFSYTSSVGQEATGHSFRITLVNK